MMQRSLANGPKLCGAVLLLTAVVLSFRAQAGDDSSNPISAGSEEERILIIHALPFDSPRRDDQPGLVPVSLLLRDYATWTPAQQALVPKAKFDEFQAIFPNTQGICQNADPTSHSKSMSHQRFWQTLEYQPVVVLGEVEHAEAAWDFIESSARTIVTLRVTRVLKNGGYYIRPVVPGDVLYLANRDGSFAFNGGRACSFYPFAHSPDPVPSGSQWLVAGTFGEHNRHYMQTVRTSRFPIREGQIQPAVGWGDAAPISFAEVLARIVP
jgi:hypothetical protein